MARTISLHYTVFITDAFYDISQMAKHTEIDFWNYTSPSGKSLKKGFDTLLPYLQKDKKWMGQQIKDFDFESAVSLLANAESKFNCITCTSTIKKIAEDKAKRLRINLLTTINF